MKLLNQIHFHLLGLRNCVGITLELDNLSICCSWCNYNLCDDRYDVSIFLQFLHINEIEMANPWTCYEIQADMHSIINRIVKRQQFFPLLLLFFLDIVIEKLRNFWGYFKESACYLLFNIIFDHFIPLSTTFLGAISWRIN